MDTKALRQKVLDLAIRGKLVPQDPNDEPASVLLERIRQEKQQMVKEGKLKPKDIKNDSVIFKGDDNLHYEKFTDGSVKCIEDEIPFKIPESWEWCRLNDLFFVRSSKRVLKSEWKKSGVPFYRAREIARLSESGFVNNELFISQEHYTTLKKEYGVPNAGDLMITGVGTIGKVYVVKTDDTFYYKDASVLCFENRYNAIDPFFAKYLIESTVLQSQIHNKTYGNTVDTITIQTASNYLCLLPPTNEQKRIVNTIEKAISHIKHIGESQTELAEIISLLKSKILDLAIRGKLVPQDPEDEPASVLLERIRAEKEELIKQGKIKRDKSESVIFKGDDNSYYEEIPNKWEETSIINIADVELGKTLDSKNNTKNLFPYLRSINIKWNDIDLSDLKQMRFDPEEIDRYTVKKGDLLICEGGDVGRCCVWNKDETIFYQNAIHRVRFYANINAYFFMYYFMYLESIGYLKHISNGVTIKHLTKRVLSTIPLLLPPIEEQNRIVAAIQNTFIILDSI